MANWRMANPIAPNIRMSLVTRFFIAVGGGFWGWINGLSF